jgi:hypothetical protein
MIRLPALLAFVLAAAVAMPAAAADNKQNTKMTDCQKQAGDKNLTGKDRQDFVNQCLKTKPASTKASTSNKMAECNAKTKGMSKDEAAKARSECMKAG